MADINSGLNGVNAQLLSTAGNMDLSSVKNAYLQSVANMQSFDWKGLASQAGSYLNTMIPTPHSDLNSNNSQMQGIRQGILNGLMSSGNPYTMAAGAIWMGVDKLGGSSDASEGLGGRYDTANEVASFVPGAGWFTGKTDKLEDNLAVNLMLGAYGDVKNLYNTALKNSGAKLLFGKSKANRMTGRARAQGNMVADIQSDALDDFNSMYSMTGTIGARNSMALSGGPLMARAAKLGTKLENLKWANDVVKGASGFRFNRVRPVDINTYRKKYFLEPSDLDFETPQETENLDMNRFLQLIVTLMQTKADGQKNEEPKVEKPLEAPHEEPKVTEKPLTSNTKPLTVEPEEIVEPEVHYGPNKLNIDPETNAPGLQQEHVFHKVEKLGLNKFDVLDGALILTLPTIDLLKRSLNPEEASVLFKSLGADRIRINKEGGPLKFYAYEEVPKFKEGGTVNVIPEGALHKNKHHMEDAEGLTKKGIPVVTIEDGKKIQLAEIELREIILNLELTNKLEALMKKLDETDDEKEKRLIAIEAGKLLTDEILNNTIDPTNLIKEC